MSQIVQLSDIAFDRSPRVRHSVRPEAVDEYAERYIAKQPMPPVVLFTTDSHTYFIGDGLHRLSALIKIEGRECVADVRTGGYEEALRHALVANERHGVRRSNEDKRMCVAAALRQWPNQSNNAIAIACMVHDRLVQSVREEMVQSNQIESSQTRTTTDGRTIPASNSRSRVADDVTDSFKRPVPVQVRQYWQRRAEVQDLLAHIAEVRRRIHKAQQDSDLMYAEVNISAADSDLHKVALNIGTAIPFAVCTECSGHPETKAGGCRLCRGRGLISKFRWNTVPVEIRRAIEASNA